MACQNVNNLVVVTLASTGHSYLGVLGDNEIFNSMEVGLISRTVFEDYIQFRNIGQLSSIKLSPSSDYTTTPLSDIHQAEWASVQSLFVMAQKQAKPYAENRVFSDLYAGK